jgi:hypothetical protein
MNRAPLGIRRRFDMNTSLVIVLLTVGLVCEASPALG